MTNTTTNTKQRLVWATDTHLDHICVDGEPLDDRFDTFIKAINNQRPDHVVLTGDISNAHHIKQHLAMLREQVKCKSLMFVLGNHDYYGGSIAGVRQQMTQEVVSDSCLFLSVLGYVPLTTTTSVVGHDGWYDGLYADWFAPGVVILNDYTAISELREKWWSGSGRDVRTFGLLQKLAGECAAHIRKNLTAAAQVSETVVFATHVPPFRENSRYMGAISNNYWMPNFSSKLAGDALVEVAAAHPSTKFVVLCGHSHGEATFHRLPNLVCRTGKAEYGIPELSIQLLELD